MQPTIHSGLTRRATRSLALGAAACLASTAHADLLGPTPYIRFADSPFAALALPDFQVETFEDGALLPGVIASAGHVVGPGGFTDSVDEDDGSVDGSGNGGNSWYSGNTSNAMRFSFDAASLGGLPTLAGIVWTDVGNVLGGPVGISDVVFEAFDAMGASLGTIGPVTLGDGSALGQTAEDRFFGVTNVGGISAIELRMPSSVDWEIDHIQFGGIPEPATFAMLLIAISAVRRR